MAGVAATNLTGNANTVAWICFFAGIVLLVAGVVIGLYLSFMKTTHHRYLTQVRCGSRRGQHSAVTSSSGQEHP